MIDKEDKIIKKNNRPKKLILKARMKNGDGDYEWHDKYVLDNALTKITQGKTIMQIAPFISIANKIALKAEEMGLGKKTYEQDNKQKFHLCLPEFSVILNNQEAKLLWKELEKLPIEDFGVSLQCAKCGNRIPNVPNVGILSQMLFDIAYDLGETLLVPDDDIISDEEKE